METKIDAILKRLHDHKGFLTKGQLEINIGEGTLDSADIHRCIDAMKVRGLLVKESESYSLSEEGDKAFISGYKVYVEYQNELRELQKDLAQSNLDVNSARINHWKYIKWATAINVILGVVNLLGLTALGKAGRSIALILSKSPDLMDKVLETF